MAFTGCVSLESVVFPDSILSIGDNAFEGCVNLLSVVVPNTIFRVGNAAFDTATEITIDRSALARDESFVAALAEKILGQSDNYGIATKDDLATVSSNTIAQVQASPNAYNLYSANQYAANYNTGVAAGTALVTANPASYNLYTSNSIMDLRMGGLMVQRQGGNAVVAFQTQTTTDLATQPFTNNGTPITNTVQMPGNKGFIRIQAKPNPTPTAH